MGPSLIQKLSTAVRLPFMAASLIPALAAGALAYHDGFFSLPVFLAAAAAVLLSHAGTNLANDYFDFKAGNYPQKKTGPTGGSFAIQQGLFTEQQILEMALFCFALSLLAFAALAIRTHPGVFLLGLAGNFLGFFYSAPPFKFGYRHLGEIATFLGMGPLLAASVYLAQAGTITPGSLALSVFLGFLVSNVLLAAQIPDIEIDRKSSKRTIASVWGEGVLQESFAFSALLGAAALLYGVFYASLPAESFLGLAGTAISLRAAHSMRAGKHMEGLQGSLFALQAGGLLAAVGMLI